jgi:two-component system sensor histidine kinase KdpD
VTPRQKNHDLELISAVGHELRSPLTVIRGAATLLLQTHGQMPAERQAVMLRLIEQHTENMSDLVEDLITAAHVEAGDLEVRLDQVDVATVVDEVVDWARKQDAGRPILVFGSAPGLTVRADFERAVQVLRVLVANALKHAPDSNVEISVQPQHAAIRIGVLDRGPGIPEGERDRVFERFGRSADGGGAGIGLYLARGLARVMGGDVTVETRRDGGSAFWFTLGRSG